MLIAAVVALASMMNSQPHTADWLVEPDRTWIGAHWWANRLQDWAIEDGSLVCLMAGPRMPVRTAHWITRSLDPADGPVDLSVDVAPADGNTAAPASAFAA